MKKILLNEKLILAIVVLNVMVIFVQECGVDHLALSLIDIVCTLIFVAEMVVKHREYGLKGYWRDRWNALDGIVTLLSVPALLAYVIPAVASVNTIIIFRALRVFKLFRTARRFPHLTEIWAGFKLALRQSAGFLLGYFIVIVVISMFNSALFGKVAPQYFDTPLDAIYSVFRFFTVEGWYEIPEAVVGNLAPVWMHVIRLYFCLLLIGGGIIGMSLINSIFVDALAADNNDDVKAKLDDMERKLDRLLEQQKKDE